MFVLGALFPPACAAAAASTHQCRLPHSLCVEPLSANFCNFAFDDDDEVVGMDGTPLLPSGVVFFCLYTCVFFLPLLVARTSFLKRHM
uniref:Putative secreted protein n=1 Tax=Ixodes ricinus TaxID=34613 RepID=A0A6B0TZJ9_IXORI